MFDVFGSFQALLSLLLLLGALGLMGYAFVDALRVPADAFPAAGKQTKNIWLIILGVALAINIVLLSPISIFGLAGVIAAGIYVVDVRPAVKQTGRGRGSNEGPYGPW